MSGINIEDKRYNIRHAKTALSPIPYILFEKFVIPNIANCFTQLKQARLYDRWDKHQITVASTWLSLHKEDPKIVSEPPIFLHPI